METGLAKRTITPLWIVALFVSLTELVLAAAVTQTVGSVQIALTTFVIVFPCLIAAIFFAVLWFKPYVFYPPREFGPNVQVKEYVEAMQFRSPGMLVLNKAEPPTPVEAEAASDLANRFLQENSLYGLLAIYACYLGLKYNRTVDIPEVCNVITKGSQEPGYFLGFLVCCNATGLISVHFASHVNVTPISMNPTLRKKLADDLLGVFERKIGLFQTSDEDKKTQLDLTFARSKELNNLFLGSLSGEELTSQSSPK